MRKLASRILGKSLTFTMLSIFLLYTNVSICKARHTEEEPTEAKPTYLKRMNYHSALNDLPLLINYHSALNDLPLLMKKNDYQYP